MYFQHAPSIWEDFSQLAAGLLVVEGINAAPDVSDRLPPLFEQARQRLNQGSEGQLAEVSAWRRAYTQMGLKPTQYRSAAEALLRRFRREDDLPRLHPLVDLCNAVSLAYALPIAVFDLAGVDTYLEVRRADGTETYLAFGGEMETPPPEEIIFADAANQVHARRWTFRQSLKSVVQPATERVLIISEGLHETAGEDVPALIGTLAAQITSLWGSPQKQAILTADQPRFDF